MTISSESPASASGQFGDEPATAILHSTAASGDAATRAQINTNDDREEVSGEFRNSVAILPFANISADPANEYFCDGLAEDLLNALTKIENLKVAARTSAFHFKNKNVNVGEIGRTLGVSYVLEGSVRKAGNRLRISVQLVSAADGFHLWSERFDREMEDIFDVQDEITLAVVDALKLKFFGEERSAMLKRGTRNTEAYQYYLKGRFHWNKRTGESLQEAVTFFSRAIELDPEYAVAHAGLAESYVLFNNYRVASAIDSMPQGKAAAIRALKLDDSLAEAHNALGFVLSVYSWNQPASEKAYRRAIELNPKYPTAHHWLGGTCLLITGRFEEAIGEGKQAEKLDPLSPITSADSGVNLFYARRFNDAIDQFNRTLAIDKNFYFARYFLASCHHAMGEYPRAISEYRRALELSDDPLVQALLARTLATLGSRDEASEIINGLTEDSGSRYIPPTAIALGLAALGKKDEAFELLDQEFKERGFNIAFSRVNPVFDDLRDDPRFDDLQDRIKVSVMN
ncbi:MAG: tetratricopeptide repeat protein [Pyrinomonadaceae bacterium]